MTSHSAIRLRGSSPVVGSSRNRTRGWPTRLAARSSRRFIPPEYVRAGRSAASVSSNRSSRSTARIRTSRDVHVVEPADQDEVLAPGQVAVDRGELAGQADDAAQRARVADDVVAGDGRPAAVRREERRQDPDRGRLAGAVRTEQPEDRAFLDAQVDPGQGVDVAVRLRQTDRFDREGCHGSSSCGP